MHSCYIVLVYYSYLYSNPFYLVPLYITPLVPFCSALLCCIFYSNHFHCTPFCHILFSHISSYSVLLQFNFIPKPLRMNSKESTRFNFQSIQNITNSTLRFLTLLTVKSVSDVLTASVNRFRSHSLLDSKCDKFADVYVTRESDG